MKLIHLLLILTVLVFIIVGILLSLIIFRSPDVKLNEIRTTTEVVPQNGMQILAQDLSIPWDLVIMPDGEILIAERVGNLVFAKNKQRIAVEGVVAKGEGGLLGMALDPNFSANHWLYLYTTATVDNKLVNQVARYIFDGNTLKDKFVVLDEIKADANHNGGRIRFGPDGMLYITTGDAQVVSLAQDKNSLNGKILRVKPDGSIPEDNPFNSLVYSYGHRNPQGLAWDNKGQLWATEHGRSGVASGFDELNLIVKGGNYGWPTIQGDEKAEGMISPIIHSGVNTTWAPAGLANVEDKLFFGGLRGQALYEFSPTNKTLRELMKAKFGRLRAVEYSEGFLYITTSNTDGRGKPVAGDDKLLKISVSEL